MSIEDITIVITSFKSEKKIKDCLNSINNNCQVINVENSNNKEHKKNIELEFKNVKCILTGENLGYGKANNIGLENVKTKYALILNPDAKLLPSTLDQFLIAAKQKSDFALIGPNIEKDSSNLSNDNQMQEVKFIKGFAMFFNLSEFKKVGLFDDKFFIYLEEIDLCKRVIKNNKKIYLCKNIPIFHEGGHSHDSDFDYQMELSRNWHWMWSSFYFNRKHNGFFVSIITMFPKLISSSIKFLLFKILRNDRKKEIYYQRCSGLINSILGKSSWYRPKV